MRPGPERDELILSWLRLATKIANRHILAARGARQAHADDIRAAALEGLVRAAHGYDPSRGVPFASYARRRVDGAVLDWLRENDHLSRAERRRAREDGVEPREHPIRLDDDSSADLHEVLANPRAEDPEEAAARRRAVAAVERAALALPPRSQEILRLYYSEDLTQDQIAHRFGVVETRICQLMRAAHGALREALGQPPADRSPQAPYSRVGRPVASPAAPLQRARRPTRLDGVSDETREALRRSADERRARRLAARAG